MEQEEIAQLITNFVADLKNHPGVPPGTDWGQLRADLYRDLTAAESETDQNWRWQPDPPQRPDVDTRAGA